jgi:hypothetical protein
VTLVVTVVRKNPTCALQLIRPVGIVQILGENNKLVGRAFPDTETRPCCQP